MSKRAPSPWFRNYYTSRWFCRSIVNTDCSGGSRGGTTGPLPLNFDRLCFVFVCIRMLPNKPQIAWESVENHKASSPCFALVMCTAHLLRPHYFKILDPPLLYIPHYWFYCGILLANGFNCLVFLCFHKVLFDYLEFCIENTIIC